MTDQTPTADQPVTTLLIEQLTSDAFLPFGTVMAPSEDGLPFGPGDARLDLSAGTPRFYTMRLRARGLAVSRITRHRRVTQVLASAGGFEWVIAVAPPDRVGDPDAEPPLEAIRAFRIPGDTAIMLAVGTWHAGPLFDPEATGAGDGSASFFNLELSDTNIVDHHTCDLAATYGRTLRCV
ncbi:MAG: ureidoglycolate lyase [Actinomycetota bacterium]